MKRNALFLLALALNCYAPHAVAESETHDGFFLRLAPGLGLSSARSQESSDGGTLRFSGKSGTLQLLIGGKIGEDLLLHGAIWDWGILGPKATYEVNGKEVSQVMDGDIEAQMFAIGAGVTYYFMPLNFFVTGNLGLADFRLREDRDKVAETEGGLSLNVAVGKEWWLSDNWGLGGGVYLDFSSIGDEDELRWLGFSAGLLLTATYN
jgi:hypothetical protein